MKIRSITYFCNPRYPFRSEVLHEAGRFLQAARQAYEAAGYEVQTTRLATVPFPELLGEKSLDALPVAAQGLELLLGQINVQYASLGPALTKQPRSYDVIPDAIKATKNIFFGGSLTDARVIDVDAVRRCARVIVRCAPLDPNGFANLRFAALANVQAGSPFFPAAFHRGRAPAFALATEAADLAVEAFKSAKTVAEGQAALTGAIQKHADALGKVAPSLTGRGGAAFTGIDFSLAPFPDEAISVGEAFERMGVAPGRHAWIAGSCGHLDRCRRTCSLQKDGF